MNYKTKQLEALLFTAGEPVARSELAAVLNVTETELEWLADDLLHELLAHGLTVIKNATHIQLVTSPAVAEWLRQFEQKADDTLSRAAMETLTIVAYRGPISRLAIDAIRGVDSRAMIRQLIRRGLLTRISQAGQAPEYAVSTDFLQAAGIKRQEDLPDFETLSTHERLVQVLDL